MRFDIMTIFPDLCATILSESILGRAQEKGAITVRVFNIRDYSQDKHRRVDDYPYGGGMGMLMAAPPICRCVEAVREELGQKPHVVYMTPKGKLFDQQKAKELLQYPELCFLCGHYEGVDERALEEVVDEELSIGNFVLTGGELAAAVVVDAVSRMVPGVLSDSECFENESIYSGLLEYPQYTRPPEYLRRTVPEVLLSGHHANIERWRREQALKKTLLCRPELLETAELTRADLDYLRQLREENKEIDNKEGDGI